MAFAARRRAGTPRYARLLLAAGAATLAPAPLVVPLTEQLVASGALVEDPSPITLATVIAIMVTVTACLLVAGVVGLAGTASYAGALLRHSLDGAVIAGALCFLGWAATAQLFRDPAKLTMPDQVMLDCTPAAVSMVVCAATVGMLIIAVRRASPPRFGAVAAGIGTFLLVVGGCTAALGVCWQTAWLASAATIALAAGGIVNAIAAVTPDPGEPGPDVALQGGTTLALLPMIAVSAAGLYHAVTMARFDMFGTTCAAVVGLALVFRHHLSLGDVRSYADKLSQRESHFRQLAHTDPLTGLANRRGLLAALHSEALNGPPCVLLALDLDGFKDVNDMRGHDIGDAVLVEVGRRLNVLIRPRDIAARLGGDEFAVLMWTVPQRAYPVAQRLLQGLGEPYQLPTATVFQSVSIGLAGSATARDVPSLLRNADLALRFAKQRGKNRIEEYDASYDALLRRRTTLGQELRGAIERGELHLVFQPVVALPSIRPAGAEALLRWYHPQLGPVSPEEFIPVAEESGLIAEIGAWVLHQSCHQLSRLLAEGHDIWVSVNVSPRELRSSEYVTQVNDALATHRVPPQRLVLEVTEHVVATDLDELVGRLSMLRSTGVRIALDDFGAGYSSLGQLKRLPVDILKIDHQLVDDGVADAAAESARRRADPLIEVVVRLGQRLGLEVIAEGIWDPDHLTAVTDAGCRFGQGRLLGIAVPAEHLEAKLAAADAAVGRSLPTQTRPYQDLGRLDSGAQMRHR